MIKDEIAVELQRDNKTWKDIIGSGVDLKTVQALGRDANPVNILGLEGDESGFDKLKREIEDVLSGRSSASPIQQVEQDLPDWEDSPAFNGRAASSALPSSSHSESGLIPEGYPQIIIVETPPKYAPAPFWTKKDVEEKLEVVKDLAHKVEDKVSDAAQATKDGLVQTKDAAAAVAHDIADDPFARRIKDVTEEVTRQTAENFKKLGKDIKHDEFAREVRDTTEAVLKQTKENFKTVGHNIVEEGNFSDAVKSLVDETVQKTQAVGRSIRDDGAFTDTVKAFTEDVIRETIDRTRALGKSTRDQGNFGQATNDTAEEVAHDASVKTQRVADDIKSDSFLQEVKQAFREATQNVKEIGRDIKHDPLIHQQANLGEAKQEVQNVKAGLNEGPTGEYQRNGDGIFKLFGTFGERANVTSESKRIV